MVEMPQPGFTGVVWEAREPQRLAQDLTTGPGSVPMAEAAAAWSRLAASFGAAVVEYEQTLAVLRGAWQSGRSDAVLERVSALREWLIEAAGAAAANAARLQAQVAAYEIARLAMPDTADIANIEQVQRMLESVGGMLGAPLKAVAAQTDTDADLAKAVAARVMRSYESATEPLATPWQQAEPPRIAPDKALVAEQSARQAATAASASAAGFAPGAMPIGPVSVTMPTAVPRVRTSYQAPVYAQSGAASELVAQPVPVGTGNAAAEAVPFGPAASGGGAAPQDTPRFPRASLAGDSGDHLDGEIQAAPSVLGAVESATTDQGHAARRTGGAA
ncbi:PPE domain-containing protein [Nocardia blacklockiae]|uniref:PPE domain-containing protein n=1 Tax=Nocardia blacklockiae TaxID=480036 RepID=UPI0018933A4E|nr:PPE domain-containing protein [Nocardia blacklockiae]MBF6171399.1 PPE domain-containing protein [Nocardia blacklockiae]